MDTENTNNSAADATNTGGAAPNTPEVVFSPVTAPEEQKSPELATTTPKTPLADLEDKPAGQTAADGSTADKPAGKEAPDLVSQLLQETMRREDAERRLQALAPKKEPLKEPVISDFKTLEDYNKAMLTYGKALGAEEVSQQNERNKLINEQTAVRTAVATREAKARTKYTDYDATIMPIVPVIGSMPILREFIGGSELGSEVAYHLGKNPAVLQQLKNLSPIDLGRQLFALETRIKTASTVKQSDAPDPIKPVGNREGVRPNMAQLAEKDINGFVARRNKQELAGMH
jgi:hypothetical protein